jgi:hypothetical protein
MVRIMMETIGLIMGMSVLMCQGQRRSHVLLVLFSSVMLIAVFIESAFQMELGANAL